MKRIPVIAGPTAVGKTDIAVDLAIRLSAEIVSSDSRQVYRKLNIGTAKPSQKQLDLVKHHFIDEMDLSEAFSAGIFARLAEERIEEIQSRGKKIIVCGGSTLYLQALMVGLAEIPSAGIDVRMRLNGRLQSEGVDTLFKELQVVDPEYAATLDSTKSQRIVRGLEVYASTGRRLSSFFGSGKPPDYHYDVFVLTRHRSLLYDRINTRVDQMLDAGLVEEVHALSNAGLTPDTGALQTIGYKEVFQHLAGELDIEATADLIKRNTRRYAKRQLTWFRKYTDAIWIDLDNEEERSILSQIMS